jgi:hypothetical protein
LVTRTATPVTAVLAEVVQVIDVALTTVTPVQAVDDPIVTVAPVRNPVPVIVTLCNPEAGPEDGVIAETVGATYPILNETAAVALPDVAPVAVMVMLPVDPTVGVPETTPVDELIERPVGNEPFVTAYVTDPEKF